MTVGYLRRAGVIGAGIALTIPLLMSPAAATFPGRNGLIAYDDLVPFDTSINLIRPDGRGRGQITHRDAFEQRWSPDGTRLVFSGFTQQGNRLFVVNRDGSGLRRVSADAAGWNHWRPAYSPDGRRIVFARCAPDRGCAVAIMGADGSGVHDITGYANVNFTPQFSPDGLWISFERINRDFTAGRIYVARPDGSDARPITPPDMQAADADWAPDGSRLIFEDNCCRPNSSLWTVRPDGSGLRRLTHPEFRHNDFEAVFSPDGRQVVFASDRRYADSCCTDLFVMDANGAHLRLLKSSGSRVFLFPSWQPLP